MVFDPFAHVGKQVAEHLRHGEDGRPGAPRKTVTAPFLQLAAGRIVLLPHLDGVARAREANGGGESAQACADNKNPFQLGR